MLTTLLAASALSKHLHTQHPPGNPLLLADDGPKYHELVYGNMSNYRLSMRAFLDQAEPEIEFLGCFPR
jgi:hypothetical protein